MQKIFILAISLTVAWHSLVQNKPISAVAEVVLPKDAERIDKANLATRAKTFSVKSELQSSKFDSNLYKIDNLSLGLWDVNASEDDHRTLQEIKAQALELFKLDNSIAVDEASIKTYNGNQFLIINYHKGTSNYLKFVTKTVNKKTLNGVIESNISDKGKAKSTLEEMLKKMSFKK